MPRHLHTALAAASLALVAACGGGGDAPADPAPRPPLACLALPAEVALHDEAAGASEWKDLQVDWRNRLWLAGYDRGVLGQASIDPGGNARGVVRLLSPQGELLFDSGARFDSPGADVAEALAITDDGRLHVAGRTTGVLAGDANRGQFDLFFALGDATQPAAPWRLAQLGDERPQHPRRLQAAGLHTLYLVGHDDDHIPTNHVEAWADGFAARLDLAAGTTGAPVTLAWEHQNGLANPNQASALALHQDHVYMGGSVGSGPQRGMFVRKLSPTGGVLWTARYSSSGFDQVAALLSLPDGSLLMAGSVVGAFRGGAHRGQQDVFVARISPVDGAVLASAQFGTAGADWLTDAKVDARGQVFLYGETDGAFVAGQAAAGALDLFVLKLGSDGSLQRRWQWGTAGDEVATSIALDRCGRVVAAGSSGDARDRRALLWFPQGQ